jgi:hypothetical protein
MLKAVYVEAHDIARSSEQKQTLESIRWFAAHAGTARRPGVPNEDARTEAFIKKELQ